MMDITEIKEFLGERGYQLQMNWHETNIFRRVDGLVSFDATYPSYNEALKAGLNHWLSEQLGIHWQQLWAWARFVNDTFFYDAFQNDHIEAVEKAIEWYEALEKEEE